MSVVVQDLQTNKVYVFAKGADIAMLRILKDQDKEQDTLKCVDEFARKGYRTLVFGMKEFSLKDEYLEKDIESDLELLGVTGVEDEL